MSDVQTVIDPEQPFSQFSPIEAKPNHDYQSVAQKPEMNGRPYEIKLKKKEKYLIDPRFRHLRLGLSDNGPQPELGALLMDQEFSVVDIVCTGQNKSSCGGVTHSPARRSSEGDTYQLETYLDNLPWNVHNIVLIALFPSDHVPSNQSDAAYLTLTGQCEALGERVLCLNELTETVSPSKLIGQMTRENGYWRLVAIEEPNTCRTITDIELSQNNLQCLRETRSMPAELKTVSLHVVAAQNLAMIDNQPPNPYVKIQYRERSFTSETKRDTKSPSWNNTVHFQLNEVTETESSQLTISLFSQSDNSDDRFLGQLRIPPKGLVRLGEGVHHHSFALEFTKEEQYKQDDVSGEVFITITVQDIQQQSSST